MRARKSTRSSIRASIAGNALVMLAEDHERARKLFRQFERMDPGDRESCRLLVGTICRELEIHAKLEEEILYPALRSAIEDTDLLNEAEIDHVTAAALIEDLRSLQPEDPTYVAKFTALGEFVKQHIRREETGIFARARQAGLDLVSLGERMRTLKRELQGERGVDNLLTSERSIATVAEA